MSRSPESKFGNAAERIPAEAIERLELALIPACAEPTPDYSPAQHAHARACLGIDEDFDWLLDTMHDAALGSRQTRH